MADNRHSINCLFYAIFMMTDATAACRDLCIMLVSHQIMTYSASKLRL